MGPECRNIETSKKMHVQGILALLLVTRVRDIYEVVCVI